jgi:H+/Cl- antiporter ClcA
LGEIGSLAIPSGISFCKQKTVDITKIKFHNKTPHFSGLKMTKLTEWLVALGVFFGLYAAVITKQFKHPIFEEYLFEIKILPLVLIFLLGVRIIY